VALKHGVKLYPESDIFKANFAFMKSKGYKSWRRVRGDGNCYYRAVGTQHFEHLCSPITDVAEFDGLLYNLEKKELYFSNVENYIGGDFNIYFDQLNYLRSLVQQRNTQETYEQLERLLADRSFDLATVKLMRLLTANFLYIHYDDPRLKDFTFEDKNQVFSAIITMNNEAECLALFALPSIFKCSITIESTSNDADYHSDVYEPWGVGVFYKMAVWFRPGHYECIGTGLEAMAQGYDIKTRKYRRIKFSDVQAKNLKDHLYYEAKSKGSDTELMSKVVDLSNEAINCFLRNLGELNYTEGLTQSFEDLLKFLNENAGNIPPDVMQCFAKLRDPLHIKKLRKQCNADCLAPAEYGLSCGHSFCFKTIDNHCRMATNGQYISFPDLGERPLTCPLCPTEIIDRDLRWILRDKYNGVYTASQLRKYTLLSRNGFRVCSICNVNQEEANFIPNSCGHTCCKCLITEARFGRYRCKLCNIVLTEGNLKQLQGIRLKCHCCGKFWRAIEDFSPINCPQCNMQRCNTCSQQPVCMGCNYDFTNEIEKIKMFLPLKCSLCKAVLLYDEERTCRCLCLRCINSDRPEFCRKCKRNYNEYEKHLIMQNYRPEDNIRCNICAERHFYSEVKTLNCEHRFGEECLQSYIWYALQDFMGYVKSGTIDPREGIICPEKGCRLMIDMPIIEDLLNEADYHRFNLLMLKASKLGNLVECPNCKTNFDANIHNANIHCPQCNFAFCSECYEVPHSGNCNDAMIKKLITAMETQGPVSQCPNCRVPYLKDDNCEHVKCVKPDCGIDFCFQCSCIRSPSMEHGNHYHRPGCRFYSPPGTDVDVFKPNCTECAAHGVLCQPPRPLRRLGRFSMGEF